jgi:hypothetical protein
MSEFLCKKCTYQSDSYEFFQWDDFSEDGRPLEGLLRCPNCGQEDRPNDDGEMKFFSEVI